MDRSDCQHFVEYNHQTLWFACVYDAPLDIVQRIYHLAPTQASFQNSHDVKPIHSVDVVVAGTTPLMWTCHGFYSPTRQENNDYICNQDTVMEFLMERAVKDDPSLFTKADRLGNLPLHAAIALHARKDSRTIKTLMSANSMAITVLNKLGQSPFRKFITIWTKILQQIGEKYDYNFHDVQPNNHQHLFQKIYDWYDFIRTFFILFQSYVYHKSSQTNKSCHFNNIPWSWNMEKQFPLHRALTIDSTTLPPIFLLLLLDMFPNEVFKKDLHGNLPLHIVLSQSHFQPPKISKIHNVLRYKLFHIFFHKLICLNQKALLTPNHQQKIPLFVAIEHGHSFEDYMFQHLLLYAPQTISQPYRVICASSNPTLPETKNNAIESTSEGQEINDCANYEYSKPPLMYPFMFALSGNCNASINVGYNLLRMDPSLVKIGNTP